MKYSEMHNLQLKRDAATLPYEETMKYFVFG